MKWVLFNFFIIGFHFSSIKSQQQYTGNQVLNCKTKDDFLYTCNGQHQSCQSFLVFKSKPPLDSIPTIAALMSTTTHELARINNVTETTVFPNSKEVVIPVNCSCKEQYYKAITSFYLAPHAKTYFVVANETFQGLSTCNSLMHANSYGEFDLEEGIELKVPLRCACPTKDQVLSGTKYLLTYSIVIKDNVHDVARRFNVSTESVLKANGFSESNPTLFPFTTILIPLPAEPSISGTIILPETTSSSAKRSKVKKTLKVGISAVVFMAVLVTVLGITYMRRKGKIQDSEEITPKDLLVEIASFERIIKDFSFRELQKATKNFSRKRRIKGSVYRGAFGNQIVAIKKTGIDVSKQVNMLSKINHNNLTKLYGFCKNQDSLYLVFEYMSMGSLKEWLKGQRSKETHSLGRRVKIAMDVAHGLHYLHNFVKPMYVHMNINSSNILLDSNLRAKISNFSLARTTENGCVTAKVDVYSFGIVMLELIFGKDVVFREGGQEVALSTAMATIMDGVNSETELMCMTDLDNEENGSMEYAVQMVKLSLTCLKQDPESRPSMDEVVSSLVKIHVDLQRTVDHSSRITITKSDWYDDIIVYGDDEGCNV
ncbi:hypothetical protein L2E82_27036 [Cichorium intybus]|uniref:Uncharacterized protein n=1 Tax=Cichorium intybus TaxID=13427 RepID=A0ACB9CS03_CICIN|nr:hypothetical protein L2E82_27036 [Cichorium intybus]